VTRLFTAALLLISGGPLAARETTYVYPPRAHTLGFDRVGDWELKMFLGVTASCDNPQGITAVKLKSQDDPNDTKDDILLTLFAVNSGKGQIVYNPTRFDVSSFGKKGEGRDRFRDPLGIAANEDGQVAVADFGNSRVVFLRLEGKHLVWKGELDYHEGPVHPTDVDWAGGRFWIADAAGGRVISCGPMGEDPKTWKHEAGRLERPRGLCVLDPKDPWTRSGHFQVLVVDQQGMRLRLFNERGAETARVSVSELVDGPARCLYPEADLYGHYVVADSLGGRLLKLDPKLRPLAVMRTVDDDPKPLDRPRGVAIWRRFGQVFLVEEKGGAYLWTGTDITGLEASWEKNRAGEESLLLSFGLTETSLVTVYAIKGGVEQVVRQESRMTSGPVRQWIKPGGALEGAQSIIVKARPTYSAKKSLLVEERVPLPGRRP